MQILVSIIIVHYKKSSYLYRCLQSIKNTQSKIPYEVIVVDNDEREIIADELKNRFPWVTYKKSQENLGYGGGNNLGTTCAKGKYLFFLNPDTIVLNDTLDILIRFVQKTPNVGCVAPLLLHQNRKPFAQQGSTLLTPLTGILALSFLNTYFSDLPVLRRFWLKDWDKTTTKQVAVVPGTAFVIAKELFEKIGMFDEQYFLFFEEYDLAKRMQKYHVNNYILSRAKVIHFHGVTTKTRKDIQKVFRKSRFYFFRKHYGLPAALSVEIVSSIGFRSALRSVTRRETRV